MSRLQRPNIVPDVMAIAGSARKLIRRGPRQHVVAFVMRRSFFVFPRSRGAKQTFTIVVRRVEFDVLGLGNFPEILYRHVMYPAPFRFVISEQSVIGMAGKTCVIARHKIVLKVPCRDVTPSST
jgi:hypothetical protein